MSDNIHTAILKVMSQVGYVQKQRSPNLNYTYAGEAALISALRPAMLEAGIYTHPLEVRDVVTGDYLTAKQYVMRTVSLTVVYRFMHPASDTHIDVPSRGEASDAGDKPTSKALTMAYKYALRQTFMIETGDDPDEHPSQPAGKQAKPARAEKPAPPEQAVRTGNGGDGKLTPATVGPGASKEFQRLAKELAAGVPHYRTKDGAPDLQHILYTAAKCGYATLTKANLEPAFERIAEWAQEKHPE